MFYYSMPPPAGGNASRQSPAPAAGRRGWVRRLLRPGLALITVILVADALVGDNGYFERRQALVRHDTTAAALEGTRRENQQLRTRIRRLQEADPATIEELARRQLGMIKPGELLFIVRESDLEARGDAGAEGESGASPAPAPSPDPSPAPDRR
jgi:cell division protein FtsB